MKKELIKTDNYLLVVDDSEIKVGDWMYLKQGNTPSTKQGQIARCEIEGILNSFVITQKVIAHLPLNGYAILEGVPLLPPIEEDDVWSMGLEARLNELPYTKHLDDGMFNDGQVSGFESGAEWGYKKAREKYKFTEDDIQKAFTHCAKYVAECISSGVKVDFLGRLEMYLESLSQPKTPTHFVMSDKFYTFEENLKNGKYIYE